REHGARLDSRRVRETRPAGRGARAPGHRGPDLQAGLGPARVRGAREGGPGGPGDPEQPRRSGQDLLRSRALGGALFVVCALALLAFVPKLFWPGAAVYSGILGERALLRLGGVSKLLFLGVATAFTALATRRLERDNPARSPWLLLTLGIGAFFAGQCV